jgi:hypothetical protein
MSSVEIPSFRFADNELELLGAANGVPDDAISEDRLLDLRAAGGRGEVHLTFSMSVSEELLETVLPPSELDDPPVLAILVEQSNSGRRRLVHEMAGSLPGSQKIDWEGSLADHFGTVSFSPMLIRTRDGAEAPYAGHEGAIIATGEPFELFIDEKPPRAGNFLDIEWVSFEEEAAKDSSALAGAEGLVYFLDTSGKARGGTSAPDSAVLYLNSDIGRNEPGSLQDTLNSPSASRGAVRRIKESTFAAITAHVWGQLAARALIQLEAVLDQDEVEVGSGDSLDHLPKWAGEVVSELASSFFGNRGLVSNVAEFEKAFDERPSELQLDVDEYAQRMADPAKAFAGLSLWREGRA